VKRRLWAGLALLVVLLVWAHSGSAQFAPPAAPQPEDIGGGYQVPEVQRPAPRPDWQHWMDVGVLAALMLVIAWMVLWRRSRRLTVWAAVFGLGYFGFYRKGCVCPIGAIQNVTVALTDPNYAIPAVVVAFFFLPLAMALLFGRVFCGGACALGAIQDLVLLRPVHFPRWLEKTLGSLKWVYLAAALWFVLLRPPVGRLRFEPGQTEKTVRVAVRCDRQAEPDETFRLHLFSPQGAWLEKDTGVATIENDDGQPPRSEQPGEEQEAEEAAYDEAAFAEETGESAEPKENLPALSVADVRVKEGDVGLRWVQFRVALSEPAAQPVVVGYELVDETATQGSDYLVRDFVICRYDPFVSFFRLTGYGHLLILGGGFLLVGTVVGRPYCRFLCPYGALLSLLSRFAWKRVVITPDEELDCGLCAKACPFGSIVKMRAVSSTCFSCARCYDSCPREVLRRGEITLVEMEEMVASAEALRAQEAEAARKQSA